MTGPHGRRRGVHIGEEEEAAAAPPDPVEEGEIFWRRCGREGGIWTVLEMGK